MRLSEIKELCEKATPEPWKVDVTSTLPLQTDFGYGIARIEYYAIVARDEDLAFIAAARTELPRLVDLLDRASTQLLAHFNNCHCPEDPSCEICEKSWKLIREIEGV
jgi:hypothetical protein